MRVSKAGARVGQLLDAHHDMLLGAALFAAFMLRVWVLFDLRKTIYFRELAPDEDTYHKWAAGLVNGTVNTGFAPDFPQLPAHVFAFIYRMFGINALYLRVFNLLLGVAICALAYLCGRALYGRRAGLLAVMMCACSKSLAFYSVSVLNTNLGMLLFGAALLAAIELWCGRPERRLRAVVALALASGLLVNVRGNGVVIALLFGPAAYWIAREAQLARSSVLRLGLVFACAYALGAAAGGGMRGPASGFNFFIGNNRDNPTPYFRPVRFTSSAPEYQAKGFAIEASRRAGHRLSGAEAEAFFVRVVAEDVLADPLLGLGRLAQKALAVVHSSPSDNNHDLRIVGEFLPGLRAAFLPTWLLFALGIAAALALPRDRKLLLGAALFALYAATIVAFFAGERQRVPLILVAAPYAAGGLCQLLFAATFEQRVLWRCGFALCLFAVVAQLPLRGALDLSGPINMHALMLFDAGDLDAAERWYLRSLARHELDSESARIGLAAIAQRRERSDEAVRLLEPMPDTHYEAASKYEWLGNLALGQKRAGDAARAFAASLAIDSSRANAYKGLYIALRLLNAPAEAAAVDQRLTYVQSF